MGTGAVTRFPLLNTIFSAPVQANSWSAEVRSGDGGGAVVIAETIFAPNDTSSTVHLGNADHSLFISHVHTGDLSLI